MLITKIFNVESAHIVRNCTSERCSHSIHGHSAVIEVTFEAKGLDNAQMVMDFGLMKNEIKSFIDGMDHCYLLCDRDKDEFRKFIKENCDRWIELPFNPSAEMLSMFIYYGITKILESIKFSNGEKNVSVHSVKYHETKSGSATCFKDDMLDIWNPLVDKRGDFEINYSPAVVRDWNSPEMENIFINGKDAVIFMDEIKQQIKLY